MSPDTGYTCKVSKAGKHENHAKFVPLIAKRGQNRRQKREREREPKTKEREARTDRQEREREREPKTREREREIEEESVQSHVFAVSNSVMFCFCFNDRDSGTLNQWIQTKLFSTRSKEVPASNLQVTTNNHCTTKCITLSSAKIHDSLNATVSNGNRKLATENWQQKTHWQQKTQAVRE